MLTPSNPWYGLNSLKYNVFMYPKIKSRILQTKREIGIIQIYPQEIYN
jgi:hypothetical protein